MTVVAERAPRTGVRNAWWFIGNRKSFRTHGSLAGTDQPSPLGGRLSGSERQKYNYDYPSMDYVVTSYDTPIAWHTPNEGWYVVKEKFSSTTSRHQNIVRMSL
jgi:hypothetical protein